MGKIRVKTFDESGEAQDDKKRAKYEAKKAARKDAAMQEKPAEAETVAPVEEVAVATPVDDVVVEDATPTPPQKKTPKAKFAATARTDSKKHKSNAQLVDKNREYALADAIETLKKFKKSSFDETVELHINVTEKSVSGQVTLPHGTGKKLNIVVADDAVIEAVSNGKINFDVLIATPDMMPKLAKVARVLGPRGLMPNPKNGTVTPKPEEAIAKLSAGQITYKTEPQSPIVHTSVGKLSFDNNKLEENINTFINSIGAAKIKSATLKSTMSPGIKISC